MALGAPIASSNATMFASSSSSHASSSSFRSFATSLADARHLDVAGRLANPSDTDGLITSSGSGSSSVPTAISFAQVCLEQAERQQGAEVGEAAAVSSRAGPSSSSSWDENGAPGEESRQRWILEARTWELLHHLCADRYLHHPESDAELGREDQSSDGPAAQGSSSYYETPFSRVQDILDAKRGLRELKIIRDWLSSHLPAQHIAEVRKGYAPFSKNRLRAEKRTQVTSSKSTKSTSNSSTIRALDPDAESRGQGRWDLDDSGYSKALHRTLFEYARSGQLAAAFDLARQADQPWRAASLRGAMLYYRQDLDSEEDEDGMGMGIDGIKMVGGNRNRLLWKAVCRRLASSHAGTAMDPYERALYGSLAGHLQSVLAVSSKESWEEHLWAYVNAALEGRIEGALEGESSSGVEGQESGDGAAAGGWWGQEAGGDGAVKVVELKGEAPTTSTASTSRGSSSSSAESVRRELRDIFDRLKGTTSTTTSTTSTASSQTIRHQSDDPYRVLQQALILDELPTLLAHVESRLPQMRASVEPKRYAHLVRFFAHVVLYLRLIDAPGLPGASCNGILRYYVEVLECVAQEDGAGGSTNDEDSSSKPGGSTAGSGGDLVAMYASSLDPESAEASYAHYLKSLNETASLDEKRQALLRAREHHLDVSAVARLVVAEIFDEGWPALEAAGVAGAAGAEGLLALPSAGSGAGVDGRVTPNESRLIASLDWLILLPKTRRYDAVLQSNALMRALLCRGRVQAARELLLRLPEDLLAADAQGEEDEEDEEEVEQDDMTDDEAPPRRRGPSRLPQIARTEHLHYVAFFSCLSSQWTLLEVLSQQHHRHTAGHVGPSSMELHTWRTAVRSNVERLWRDAADDVLRGDWLKISPEENDEDEDGGEDGGEEEEEQRRQVELAAIRQLYVPEIVVRLHFLVLDAYRSLLASAPLTEGSARSAVLSQAAPLLQLVTTTLPVLVADERYKVYLEFVAASSSGAAGVEGEGVGLGGGGGGSARLKEYLGHVKDAHLLRLEVLQQQGGGGGGAMGVGGEEWEVTGDA